MRITESFEHEAIRGYKFGYHPFAKPSLYVHVFYVDGLLIDTGQPRMHREILAKVKDLPVNQIYITHHHEDHSGNIPLLRNHFQCPVYAPDLCCEMMKAPPSISFGQHMLWGDRPPYTELIPKMGQLETEQYRFEIIPIPGHAADMVALYERQQGWLFSADLYVNSYIAYFLHSEGMLQQIESIKHILTLDFDAMICSHKPVLTGGKAKLAKKLAFLEDFYGQVQSGYSKGMGAKQIFREMKLTEAWPTRLLTHGYLSKLNMVRAAVKDLTAQANYPTK